jgi:integrase
MYTAHLVMASTGLRLGELQALQVGDFRDGVIHVVHAWERKSGLKAPKWNSSRVVPVPSKTAKRLASLISSSPYRDDAESLIFYGRTAKTPIAQSFVKDSLYAALAKIGIGEDGRKKRGIVVHSWRHWFNTMLRAGGVPDVKIRQLTGHRTVSMTEHYTSFGPEHFADAVAVQEKVVFGGRDRKKGAKAAPKKGSETPEKGEE